MSSWTPQHPYFTRSDARRRLRTQLGMAQPKKAVPYRTTTMAERLYRISPRFRAVLNAAGLGGIKSHTARLMLGLTFTGGR